MEKDFCRKKGNNLIYVSEGCIWAKWENSMEMEKVFLFFLKVHYKYHSNRDNQKLDGSLRTE
jgi:hypothetical protein